MMRTTDFKSSHTQTGTKRATQSTRLPLLQSPGEIDVRNREVVSTIGTQDLQVAIGKPYIAPRLTLYIHTGTQRNNRQGNASKGIQTKMIKIWQDSDETIPGRSW